MKYVRGVVGKGGLRRRNCGGLSLGVCLWFGSAVGFGGCGVEVWCFWGGGMALLVSNAVGLWCFLVSMGVRSVELNGLWS
jgi:hypothetical protein